MTERRLAVRQPFSVNEPRIGLVDVALAGVRHVAAAVASVDHREPTDRHLTAVLTAGQEIDGGPRAGSRAAQMVTLGIIRSRMALFQK